MARANRIDVYNTFLETGVLPIFYHSDPGLAKDVVAACAAGGARTFEFTNRGDNAYRVFSELTAAFAGGNSPVLLGAGSIVDAPTAALFIAGGANFIVGPTFNLEVARVCNRHKIAYLPGCADATQISEAEEAGVEFVKTFFRDATAGENFIKTHLLAMPWTRFLQTGSAEITTANISAWFDAGVSMLGFGSKFFAKEFLEQRDMNAVRTRVEQAIAIVKQVRAAKA